MAGDYEKFQRASRRWEQFHQEQLYSRSPELGTKAILYSLVGKEFITDSGSLIDQTEVFSSESKALAKQYERNGFTVKTFEGVTFTHFGEALSDPDISDIIVVGNGSFSTVNNDDFAISDTREHIDWDDLSRMTTHLKQGLFIQRTCGHFARNVSIPLGLFVVSHHSNNHSSQGEYLSETIDEDLITPICSQRQLSYRDVRTLFQKHAS